MNPQLRVVKKSSAFITNIIYYASAGVSVIGKSIPALSVIGKSIPALVVDVLLVRLHWLRLGALVGRAVHGGPHQHRGGGIHPATKSMSC